jgi:hypothetical protein
MATRCLSLSKTQEGSKLKQKIDVKIIKKRAIYRL